MPVQTFTSINDLVAYVQAELPTNGEQEITAARHREVMQSTILSLMAIVSSLPPELVLDYPEWDSEELYVGAVEVIVRHNNKLWLFVSGTGQTGVEPGNNFMVWMEVSSIQAAHLRNQDTHLAFGTGNQVSAAEIRAALDSPVFWGKAVLGIAEEPGGGEEIGDAYIVSPSVSSGVFDGYPNYIATLLEAGWHFEPPQAGDVRVDKNTGDMYAYTWEWALAGGHIAYQYANVAWGATLRIAYSSFAIVDDVHVCDFGAPPKLSIRLEVETAAEFGPPITVNGYDYLIHLVPTGTVALTWDAAWGGTGLLPTEISVPWLIRAQGVQDSPVSPWYLHVYSATPLG